MAGGDRFEIRQKEGKKALKSKAAALEEFLIL
jgi:hypothetical protein